ncbi:MAG TPA: S8 family serine peptidase [Candidatus Nitrosotalea sp.]|nr:S8 family serine peptidase [Candidatus Nitrosotalea sp.]
MNGPLKLVAPLAAALAIAACNANSASNVPPTAGGQATTPASSHFVPTWEAKHEARRACKDLAGGVSCHVLISNFYKGPPPCNPSSTCGFTPSDLQTRYGLTSSLGKGAGTIVAVIELGDLPSASSDLSQYRSTYGLGTASFTKYNESGQQYNYPPSCSNYGFCLEEDLDIDMVSAACPQCTIYMIEGGNCGKDICGLENAEVTAVKLGATIISNSWGCHTGVYGPNCGDPNFENYFNTPNIAYLASSGDSGYNEIEWPAALQNVLAVGGTQLEKSGSNFTETVWDGAGAGCATTITKPSWQHDPLCSGRTISDISAQSGCSPGVAVYEAGYGGWTSVCGTSVASPLTAGIVALAGNASSIYGGQTFWQLSTKKHRKLLHVIKSGSDGSCGNTYLCEAGAPKGSNYKTYDGPAGWGSPNGIKAY